MITEETALKRFAELDGSQESVETVALYFMHHHKTVDMWSKVWMRAFDENADKPSKQLALFYFANDVCQRSKRKHPNILAAFIQPIVHAIESCKSNNTLRPKVERCINIWSERKVFASKDIAQFRQTLGGASTSNGMRPESPKTPLTDENDENDKPSTSLAAKGIPKPSIDDLMPSVPSGMEEALESFDLNELSEASESLSETLDDLKSVIEILEKNMPMNLVERVKSEAMDKKQALAMLEEYDKHVDKVKDFKATIQVAWQLLATLEERFLRARMFFGQQCSDCKVLVDAYVEFEQQVHEVKAIVEEQLRTGVFPGASPPRDAPSPTAEDDIFAGGVEAAAIKLKAPGARDRVEAQEMDVDDTLEPSNVQPINIDLTQPPPMPFDPRRRGATAQNRVQSANTLPIPFPSGPPPPPQYSPTMPPQFSPSTGAGVPRFAPNEQPGYVPAQLPYGYGIESPTQRPPHSATSPMTSTYLPVNVPPPQAPYSQMPPVPPTLRPFPPPASTAAEWPRYKHTSTDDDYDMRQSKRYHQRHS